MFSGDFNDCVSEDVAETQSFQEERNLCARDPNRRRLRFHGKVRAASMRAENMPLLPMVFVAVPNSSWYRVATSSARSVRTSDSPLQIDARPERSGWRRH